MFLLAILWEYGYVPHRIPKDGDRRTYGSWHLDKRIPLALIGTVLVQTVAITWFAAGLYYGQEAIREDQVVMQSALQSTIDALQKSNTESRTQREDIRLRLTKIEERLRYTR